MFAKLVIKLGLCLLLTLAATSCIGGSPEVASARAHYIDAKARLIEAQVAQTKAQTSQIEQQTQLAQQTQEENMALRREQSRKLVELAQTLLPWALGFSGAALCVAVAGIIGRRLIEADRQRQEARARALKEERRLVQVWIAATRRPVTAPDSGGDGRKPAVLVDTSKVDILQLLHQLREQYPV